jgi:hypothetical protein
MSIPWPLRSVFAGAGGTAAMTATYGLERRLRRTSGRLDYDDGPVPGQIVASILHLSDVSTREEDELGLALRWSYGSCFGILHGLIRHRVAEPQASAAFAGVLIAMTFTMFPLLGHTPPPWRWPGAVIATSVGTHVAYVAAVAVVDDALRSAYD